MFNKGRANFQPAAAGWKLALLSHPLALLAEQADCFVDHFFGDVERRPEPDRAFTGFQREDAAFEKPFPELVARRGVGQIEGEEQTATARSGDHRFFLLQFEQAIEKVLTNNPRVLDQLFLLMTCR